jgi:hypothetical protein
MLCPFCLVALNPGTVTCNCKEKLPDQYVALHSGWRAKDPLFMSVVGFPGHGKTNYLGGLYQYIQRELPKRWPGFYRQGLTTETLRSVYGSMATYAKMSVSPRTEHVFPRPNIDRMLKLPKHGDRTLVIYDPPGEAFETHSDDLMSSFASFVRYSKVAVMLISPSDLLGNSRRLETVGPAMYRLIEQYDIGLRKLGGKPKEQHLVVVYTKGDRMLTDFDLPPAVGRYLLASDEGALGDVSRYVKEMTTISRQLEEYTARVLDGMTFINNARDQYRSLEFSIVSALGAEPDGDQLSEPISPKRVIDPFLWVLERC